jgi:hypothetical protein
MTDPGMGRTVGTKTWILMETGIVVVGILIAFSVNSWWESRSAQERERAHLHALRADFAQNAERLERLADRHDGISEHSRALLVVARQDRSLPPDSVVRLVGEVFSSDRFDPVMGAYQGLVHSGGLAQLQDDSLRTALATFASRLDSRYAEFFATELYLSFNREFMGHTGAAEWVLSRHPEVEVHGLATAFDFDPVLRDPRFQEYLAIRHSTTREVAGYYRELGRQAAAVLERIEELVP